MKFEEQNANVDCFYYFHMKYSTTFVMIIIWNITSWFMSIGGIDSLMYFGYVSWAVCSNDGDVGANGN
jgi:hypothetical protein